MKTVIIYYSQHHGNTKKLLDAMAAADPDVALIDVTSAGEMDLTEYDRIGITTALPNRCSPVRRITFRRGSRCSSSTPTGHRRWFP